MRSARQTLMQFRAISGLQSVGVLHRAPVISGPAAGGMDTVLSFVVLDHVEVPES